MSIRRKYFEEQKVNLILIYTCLLGLITPQVVSKVRIDPLKNELEKDQGLLSNENDSGGFVYPEIPRNSRLEFYSPRPDGPHFDKDSPEFVVGALGSPAHIPCNVRNLGSKSVSWIRHRDLHVLTVGSFTFTNDDRFSAHRDPLTGDWVLVLRHPQTSDSGFYECSISTKPVTSHTVKLNVVVPSSEMLGKNKHVYLDQGSTLNLTCVVQFSPTAPEFILWYHREKLVDYGMRGRDIHVKTIHEGDTTHSSLLILNATMDDSGKYSCKPSNAKRVTVQVHVLRSETPAAMQTTTTNNSQVVYKPSKAFVGALLIPQFFIFTFGFNFCFGGLDFVPYHLASNSKR